MFFVSINEKEREHSNSLHNIFVFVNEVFNIVRRVFLLQNKLDLILMRYAPIYTLGIFPHLSSQNV